MKYFILIIIFYSGVILAQEKKLLPKNLKRRSSLLSKNVLDAMEAKEEHLEKTLLRWKRKNSENLQKI
jgi:hypothetical protein